MDAPKPGITTTEGLSALIAIGAPLVAAVATLTGWPLVAALGIAALVACVYIAARTWLKRGAAAAVLLCLLARPASAEDPVTPRAPVVLTLPADTCPEPCAACAQRVVAATVPAAQPMPTWAKALLGVAVALGGTLTAYQQGHAMGTW